VDTGDGVEYCETRQQAMALAERAIEHWREQCDPEWLEEVEGVCWGPVMGQSVMIEVDSGERLGLDYWLSNLPANGEEGDQ
jgi:hypothetical protein